ncbi:MAG: mechanosensitive ion channel family protein, partial [Deltaproteobacteria bacterium]|nr:mechanosensitive ion channel family protein [Deltaproteobacteria bacterium]
VNFVVRPWVKKENYWNVKCDLIRKIKESFDENGIEIPFPQQVVHMISQP